jgi:hypothetical protein
MTDLTIVVIKPETKGYIFTSQDLEFVRNHLLSLRGTNSTETEKSVHETLSTTLTLPSNEKFSVSTKQLTFDLSDFTITSDAAELNPKQLTYMRKLLQCAAATVTAIIVCPSYIHIKSPTKRQRKKPKPGTS